MNAGDNNIFDSKPRKFWLATALALLGLTAVLILGIKIIIGGGDSQLDMPPSKALSDFRFQDTKKNKKPGPVKTAPPADQALSGGSLEMFTRVNAPPPVVISSPALPAAPQSSSPETAPAPKPKPAPKPRPVTVIPKMQAVPTFGSNIKTTPQGVSMPDISNVMKQAIPQNQTGNR
jgi:hypothetical protein